MTTLRHTTGSWIKFRMTWCARASLGRGCGRNQENMLKNMKHGHPNKLWMNHKSYTELTLEIIIRKLNTDLMSQCHIHTHVADYQWFKPWHYVYCHFHHCHKRDGRDSGVPYNVTTQGHGFQCLTPHGDVVTLKSSMKIIFSLKHAAFRVPVCRF